jgi:hypothetical protein
MLQGAATPTCAHIRLDHVSSFLIRQGERCGRLDRFEQHDGMVELCWSSGRALGQAVTEEVGERSGWPGFGIVFPDTPPLSI